MKLFPTALIFALLVLSFLDLSAQTKFMAIQFRFSELNSTKKEWISDDWKETTPYVVTFSSAGVSMDNEAESTFEIISKPEEETKDSLLFVSSLAVDELGKKCRLVMLIDKTNSDTIILSAVYSNIMHSWKLDRIKPSETKLSDK